jgi:hypothetical protein
MLIYTHKELIKIVCNSADDFANQAHVQMYADGWKSKTVCYVMTLHVGCGRSICFFVLPVSDSFQHTWQSSAVYDGALKGPICTSASLVLATSTHAFILSVPELVKGGVTPCIWRF